MKKIFKIISVICTILVVMFLIYCFIPEDEYYDDSYYSEEEMHGHDSSYEYPSNNVNTDNNVINSPSVANSISEQSSLEKQELIAQGLIREPQVKLKGNGEDSVTILIYMNGSDLESESNEATTDLTEMIQAGSSDKVTVLVQTMGTKKWSTKYGINSNRSQRYELNEKGMKLVDDSLGQLDCTKSETLTDFIKWGVSNYTSDRYFLLFWNHGGGPVYGFGYDEWNSDEYACLSADEIKQGLKQAGVYFDFIGMDCCIMSCLEAACAFYDYADYFITSEDFESGLGWSYTPWLKALYENTSISTPELGKLICDSMVDANEKDKSNGDDSIMSVIDLSMMKLLYASWVDFAYANKDTLLGTNYSERIMPKKGGRVLPSMSSKFGFFEEDYQMSDYYITDIMAVAQNIDSTESASLSSAVSKALVYVRASQGDAALTGISVTLPYSDSDFYSNLNQVFTNIGIDEEYINWLEQFTYVNSSVNAYDYDDWSDSWGGWDDYEDDYDWSDWYDYYDDDYADDYYWDDFDYSDSYNFWYDLYDYLFDDEGYYNGDDYYYDDYFYEDDYYYFYD